MARANVATLWNNWLVQNQVIQYAHTILVIHLHHTYCMQTITYAWKPKYILAFSVKKLEPNTKIAWIPIEMTRLQKFADTTVNVTSPLHNAQLREKQFIRNGEGRDKKT